MKVLIYGAGVIGTLYSGKLADAGHKATVVARGQRLGAKPVPLRGAHVHRRWPRQADRAGRRRVRLLLNCTRRQLASPARCGRLLAQTRVGGKPPPSPHAGQAGVVSRVPRRGRVSTSQTIELCLECHCYATVLLLAQLHSGKLE